LSTGTALSLLNFTWAQTPTSLNPYIGTIVTKLNPGQTFEEDKQTIQTLDQYGNVLTVKAYNYGAGAVGSLARTYTNTYLYSSNSNYTSLYILNRLKKSTVTDGINTATLVSNSYDGSALANVTGTLHEHDSTYSTSFIYRGNVTNSKTTTTTTVNTYDITGNVTTTTVNGVATTVTTTSATNYAAPAQVTAQAPAGALTSTMNWSGFLGLSSAAGPNGDTGSISYDSYARPQTTTSPYGAVTTYAYGDTASPPYKQATTNGHWVTTFMDGFGRMIGTTTGYGATTVSLAYTTYAPCGCSPLGKLSQQSEPYALGGTPAAITYTYDASGRTLSLVLPDNSTTSYVYQGNQVTVTDPAGKWKTFTMDAFGNLVSVVEYDPTLPGNVTTNYTYDVLNHLTTVSMPRGTTTQTRTFNYTTGTTVGGFLLSATNPENGTVNYTYNSGTNTLASKTDAKSQKLTYQYDVLNRLTSVTWASAAGAPVLRQYSYDVNTLDPNPPFSSYTLGRLVTVQYQTQAQGSVQMYEMYSYTPAGSPGGGLPSIKLLQVNQNVSYAGQYGTATANIESSYTYNNQGEITSISYPDTETPFLVTEDESPYVAGPVYNYSYDSMYRLSGMTDSNNNTIVSNVSYNAANQLLTINYPAANEVRGYNVLNQLTSLSAGSENLTYSYPTGTNNGKVSSMYNAVSGETITYTYDSLNRIATASGSGWGEQYTFDPFGNLTEKHITSGSGPSLSISVNSANNQIQGVTQLSYDANGNTSTSSSMMYDAENRLIAAGGLQYAYDEQNERIFSWSGGIDGGDNPTGYLVSMYSPTGQKLATYQIAPQVLDWTPAMWTQVTLVSSDQYFGGRRLAVLDQLGSAGAYYPWGENKGSTNPQDTWSFATYWEDSATGFDYANNRYYSNAYGRFMTPDPYQGTSGGPGDPNNPQSWNRYAYVTGDPVNSFDPQGLDDCPAGSAPGPNGDGSVCLLNVLGPGGGGGGNQVAQEKGQHAAPPSTATPWSLLSVNCRNALTTAMPNTPPSAMLAALGRALGDQSVFQSATAGTNISWIMLAAIAIRETGVQDLNENDGAGVGVGVFQITVTNNNQNPANGPTAAEANNLAWAAGFAANLLNTDMAQLGAKFPNFTPAQLLQATADSYNFGVGNISGNPNTMDVGSAHNNYGSNVMQLMNCFP
jgi:RHS repeat-associated protein